MSPMNSIDLHVSGNSTQCHFVNLLHEASIYIHMKITGINNAMFLEWHQDIKRNQSVQKYNRLFFVDVNLMLHQSDQSPVSVEYPDFP